MRITRDFLLNTAKDHVSKRTRSERDLLAAYLVGSVLRDEPLLGGTTDIDLILIHAGDPKVSREMVRVNEDVHLDIAHHSEVMYQQPRALRVNPWLGTAVQDHPALLYDVRHWFEFTQASAGAQFYRSDQTLARSRCFLDSARAAWAELNDSKAPFAKKLRKYMCAVEDAANAAASLAGSPLTRRRFLLDLPGRCAEIDAAGLIPGMVNLLQLQDVTGEFITKVLPDWEKTFRAAGSVEQAPADLHILRLGYYRRAIEACLADEEILAAAFPLFSTWSKAAACLPVASPEYAAWLNTLKEMGLGREQLAEKVEALDAYLDHVEEVLESWGSKYGA